MNSKFIQPRHKYLFVIIAAVLSLLGLFINQQLWSGHDLKGQQRYLQFAVVFHNKLSDNSISHGFMRVLSSLFFSPNSLVYFLSFAALIVLFWYVFVEKPMIVKSWWILLLSAIYGYIYILTPVFQTYQKWNALFNHAMSFVLFFVQLLGITLLLYTILSLIFYGFTRISSQETTTDNTLFTHKTFLKYWGLIFLNWLIYLVLFYPINTDNDFASQVASFFGGRTGFYNDTVSYLKNTSVITDHHPVFTTFIYGVFAKVGVKLGSINFGIFLFGLFSILLYSFICVYSLKIFTKYGLTTKSQRLFALFYAFFPLFPLYAGTATKNVPYSFLMIILLIQLFELMKDPETMFKSRKFMILFSIILFGQMLVVKYAVQVTILFTIAFVLVYKKYFFKALIITFLPIIVFLGLYQNMLLPALHITKTNPTEALSLPFQQTARFVKTYPSAVSKHDHNILNRVFFYNKIAKNYKPELSDPIKDGNTVRMATLKPSDLRDYRSVWIHQFFQHPMIYVEATLNNIYGFFSLTHYSSFGLFGINMSPGWNVNEVTGNPDLKLLPASKLSVVSHAVSLILVMLSYLPVIGLLMQPHTFLLLTLLVAMSIATKRLWRYELIMSPLLLNVLVDITSPANALFRYMIVFVICAPFVIWLLNYALRHQTQDKE